MRQIPEPRIKELAQEASRMVAEIWPAAPQSFQGPMAGAILAHTLEHESKHSITIHHGWGK